MHFDDVFWLSVEHVDAVHDDALRISDFTDEIPGKLDAGVVESAVLAPRNSYPRSLAEVAVQYLIGIGLNHGYHNANKRTALASMALFLEMNGFPADPPRKRWLAIMSRFVNRKMSTQDLIAEVVVLMGGTDVPIEL